MGLMDVLRKLGVVQSGSVTATYSSAKDRPVEFQDDGMVTSRKVPAKDGKPDGAGPGRDSK